jgi:energy-coupling factor transport system ATP-binding protein
MLAFSHVHFSYLGSDTPALDDVSFTLAPGQRLAVLGANGSGKSTLARLANGLLLPHKGEVSVNGMLSSDNEALRTLRQSCGVVAQNPDTQIVCTTVFDEVAFGPQNLGLPLDEIHTRVKAALRAVKLDDMRTRDPNSLSGGEKQRVVIAGVCAMQPDFVVFDEPSSMLDAEGRAEVLSVVQELQRNGHGILYITHRLEEARLADGILVLDAGRIVFQGSVAEFETCVELVDHFTIEPVKRINKAYCARNVLTDEGVCEADVLHRAFVSEDCLSCEAASSAAESPAQNIGSGAIPSSVNTFPDVLLLEDVVYTYSAGTSFEHQALKGINLAVEQGSITLVQGHTGSGKSTLLRIAAGLLAPTEGSAYVKSAQKKSTIEAKTVGIVFQHPESQLFAHTVFDDIAFGPRNLQLVATRDETEQRVRKACALVGLDFTRFAERSPFSLSGGEARRVALAGILAMEPQFLLLDEPTAGLDAEGHHFVAALVSTLAAQGVAVLVVSHEVDFFLPLAHEVIKLEKGAQLAFVPHHAETSDALWQ